MLIRRPPPEQRAQPAGRDAVEALREVVLERGYRRSEEPFVLSSGRLSHDYVDMRRALARGPDLGLAASVLLELASTLGFAFDAAGGMTMGADPLAHALAVVGGVSWFSVRKAAKDHGAAQRVEGAQLGPGVRVLLLEDTVSTGRSGIEALQAVRETGATVVHACALLDRADVAAALFAEHGVPYTAVLTYRDLGIEPLR